MRVRLEKDNVVVALHGQCLARGGEAAIYPIEDRPSLLAKVYHQASPEQADKLTAMIANPPADPTAKQGHTSIAWPTDRLLAEGGGPCVGFVMPRVDKVQSLFAVYNPKSRSQTWPLFHYGYLLRTARNLSIAVRALHARGYVLGDLNESNVLVNGQTLVTVVDTDSFQTRAGKRVFRCTVGKPEFIAPEIQGADLAATDRTPEHDHFALGVLIFQLLMQGSHPFAGRFTGEGEPGALARRIAAGHWPHARKRRGPFAPTPTAVPFAALPTQLRELMRLCFEDGHDRPAMRPDAGRWQKALAAADAELIECLVNSQHRFHKDQEACPWCELAKRQGRDPFPSKEKVKALTDGAGGAKPGPTAVASAKSKPKPPSALKTPAPTAFVPQVRNHVAALLSSIQTTPRPWVLGGAGLVLCVGLAWLAAVALWPAAPRPVVFGPPTHFVPPTPERFSAERPGPAVEDFPRGMSGAAPGGLPADAVGGPDFGAAGFGPDGPPAFAPGAGGAPLGVGFPRVNPPGAAGAPAPPPAQRRMPDLLLPDESRTAVVRFQLPCFVFSKDFQNLLALKGVPAGASGMAPNLELAGRPLLPNNPRSSANAQKIFYNSLNIDADPLEQDYQTIWVSVAKIQDLDGMTLAEQLFPVRAAEIVAAFPFKKQVQEFRDKLALRTDADVFQETAVEAARDGAPMPSFCFLGVSVERRQTDAKGEPVGDKSGWAPLDLDDAYKPLLVFAGGRSEEEKPDLTPVAFPDLVMRKLPTFDGRRNPPIDDYPKIEAELKNLTTTLEALPKDPEAVARPAPLRDPGPPADKAGPLPPSERPPLFGPPGGAVRPGDVAPAGPAANSDLVIPEYCLIRLFDATIEPGKIYEYRLRPRMANPNFGRKDAAAAAHPDDKELVAKDWYVLPEKLTVPPEVFCYAVDQKAVDANNHVVDPKGAGARVPPIHSEQTLLQLHRWFDYIPTRNRGPLLPVGDWVIAERVAATLGEPIGRQQVEAPYWRTAQARFMMPTNAPAKPNAPRAKGPAMIETPFFPDGEEPILVDFTGGDLLYKRAPSETIDAPAAGRPLPALDRTAVEVLLYTADGKLLAHSSAADAADPARGARLNACRDRIEQVKNAKGGKDGDGVNPFGP